MAKKVLLQINTTANVTATGRIAEGIGNIALQKGYEYYHAYGILQNPSQAQLLRMETYVGWHFNVLRARLFDDDGFGSERTTKWLVKKIECLKPDVVIVHNLHGYYINIRILLDCLRRINVPVIYILHDCWAMTGHCAYFTTIGCNRWKDECGACPQLNTYPNSWGVDHSRKNLLAKRKLFGQLERMIVVPVSDWLKGLAQESYLGKFPIRRIYNGVDTDIFTYRSAKKDMWPNKKVLMGCALKWFIGDGKQKGLADYLKLSTIIPDNYLIVLVGHIADRKIKRNLPPNICNIERTESKAELAELYSRADVLMNLSYQEAMGMTSVEGMACGTPCVVYNATASPELITKDTGIVVEAGNIEAVLQAAKDIVSKGRDYYSQACRQHVLENFDEKKQLLKYFDLIDELQQA